MSGIYIPGMKMPKNCEECKCNYYECAFLERSAEEIMEYFGGDKRHPDCPLVEMPAQKHGKWKKAYLDHEAFGIRPTVVYCSECNLIGYWEPKYCPNCGARMDGDS